jgi:hypothetical protein
MSRQKAKGTRWESRIVDYLRERGWPHAERRTLNGSKDQGDISGIIGVVIEAKDQARHSLAEWLDEANVERDNASADLGVVWAHRRGKSSPRDGYVVMDGDTFTWLLKSAGYGREDS